MTQGVSAVVAVPVVVMEMDVTLLMEAAEAAAAAAAAAVVVVVVVDVEVAVVVVTVEEECGLQWWLPAMARSVNGAACSARRAERDGECSGDDTDDSGDVDCGDTGKEYMAWDGLDGSTRESGLRDEVGRMKGQKRLWMWICVAVSVAGRWSVRRVCVLRSGGAVGRESAINWKQAHSLSNFAILSTAGENKPQNLTNKDIM